MAQADPEKDKKPMVLELLQEPRVHGDVRALTKKIEAAKKRLGISFSFAVLVEYVVFKFYGTCYTVAWFRGRLRIKPLMTGGPAGGGWQVVRQQRYRIPVEDSLWSRQDRGRAHECIASTG